MAPKGTLSSHAAGLILLLGPGTSDVKVSLAGSLQLYQVASKRRKTAIVCEQKRNHPFFIHFLFVEALIFSTPTLFSYTFSSQKLEIKRRLLQ
jgi:hypothetical protein